MTQSSVVADFRVCIHDNILPFSTSLGRAALAIPEEEFRYDSGSSIVSSMVMCYTQVSWVLWSMGSRF